MLGEYIIIDTSLAPTKLFYGAAFFLWSTQTLIPKLLVIRDRHEGVHFFYGLPAVDRSRRGSHVWVQSRGGNSLFPKSPLL